VLQCKQTRQKGDHYCCHHYYYYYYYYYYFKLKRICVPTKNLTGQQKNLGLHIEKHHNLYSSPNILRVTTSKRMRWACSMLEEYEIHTKFWSVNLKGREYLGDKDIDVRLNLK
jgi:hypothetical protein